MAVVTANADQGRDYIANFEPFATDCLKRWPSGKPIEPDALARAICNDWDVPSMPINVAKILIKRAKKRGEAIEGADGAPYPNVERLMEAPSVAEKSQEAIARITALEDAVVAYAAEAHGLDWSRDDASQALERLTEDYGAELALARRGGLAKTPPAKATETVTVVYGFARRALESDATSFEALVTMVQGTMLTNTIYFDDIGSLSRKFPCLTAYLDGPVLLRALGLAPEPVRIAAEEMLEMLRGFGVPLRVFPHTIDEMAGILERVARNLRRGKQRMLTAGGAGGRNREVIDALIQKGWTSGEIDAMQADLGNRLSAMGVEIEDTPPHVEKDHIDEGRFTEILSEEVAYPTKPPLEKDLKSLAAVDRLRGKGRPRELGRAGAIFVTDNASVARASRLFFSEADRKAPVPHCMLDTALTAQLWVRSSHPRPDLPRKLLIASSYAALSPGPELWERWIEHIIRVRERGDVTDEQVQNLIYHSQAKSALFEVTHGNAGAIDEETVAEVLRRFERDLRRPAEAKALEAGKRAEAAERERQQIVDRLEAAETAAREAGEEKNALADEVTSLSRRVTDQETVEERRKARRAQVRKIVASVLAVAGIAAATLLVALGAVSGMWPITGVVIGGIGLFILGLALALGWKKGWIGLGAIALVVGLIAGVQQIVEKAEGSDRPGRAAPSR